MPTDSEASPEGPVVRVDLLMPDDAPGAAEDRLARAREALLGLGITMRRPALPAAGPKPQHRRRNLE